MEAIDAVTRIANVTPATDAQLAKGIGEGISPGIFEGNVRPKEPGFDMRPDAELRMSIRDSIANTMSPLLDDWHLAITKLDDVPVAEWARSGVEPTIGSRPARNDMEKFIVADLEAQGRTIEQYAMSRQPTNMLGDPIQVPVGEHGEEFAKVLAEAARVMGGVIDEPMRAAAAQVKEGAGSLFGSVTFQGTPLRAMMEAANTVAGTTAILTNKRIDGLEAADQIAALRKGRVFERAAGAPAAVWGPMVFRGRWMPNHPIEVSDKGVATLTSEMSGMLNATKAARLVSERPVDPIETALGCPFLARKAALLEAEEAAGEVSRNYIRRFADDYLKIVERLLQESAPSPTVAAG